MRTATRRALRGSYEARTDLDVDIVRNFNPGVTDISFGYQDLPGRIFGRWVCYSSDYSDLNGGVRCWAGRVHYDADYIEDNFASASSRDKELRQALACHEVGHGVGLTHGEDADPDVDNQAGFLGCMKTRALESQRVPWLGSHNISRINDVYPWHADDA